MALEIIEKIKKNVNREKEILNYLLVISKIPANADERIFYGKIKNILIQELSIVNSAIPELIRAISIKESKIVSVEKIIGRISTMQGEVSVKKTDRARYMDFLKFEEESLKDVKKKLQAREKVTEESKKDQFKQVGSYTKLAGRMFSKTAIKISKSSFFKPLNDSLKKANMPYLLPTYISMGFLGSSIAFIVCLVLLSMLIISEVISAIIGIIILFVLPIVVFGIFYFYPSNEAGSNRGKIDEELPFAIMHMSAIAGSGIEPSKIFSIIATGTEYPAIKKEMIKIINQVNFHGYSLMDSLRSAAKSTSSLRFAEILNGISTILLSGGDLKEYLNKIAGDTLLDYKLRRKRFITMSETYADIYTGLLIAAPLMFMLILVMMNVIGGGLGGMSAGTIALIGIGVLIVVNIGFLVFLQISQPEA